MDLFTKEDLKTLMRNRQRPAISIYLPTQRGETKESRIRWKNCVSDAEKRLVAQGMRSPEAKELLAPAHELSADSSFWQHQSDGLACFLAPEFFRVYRLPVALDEIVVTANEFHIKPLLPLLSGDGYFYVLALSQNCVRFLQGTRDSIRAIDLKGVPANQEEALRRHDVDEPLVFHTPHPGGTGDRGAMFHGHGVGIDDAKDDTLRYFQQIDHGLHPHLRTERAPLVVAAVDYLVPMYRKVNRYPHLLEKGILGNPDHLSDQELHDRAWTLVEPHFQEARAKAIAQYHQLDGTGRTCSEPEEILTAAHAGQVETLFAAVDKEQWGRFDADTEQIVKHEQEEPGDEDLVNHAVIDTLRHGRIVHAVKLQNVPGNHPLAAVLCLPLAKHGKRP